jgi:excisionase family DNA binding protein
MGPRLSVKQIASYCGVRRRTVANWIRDGKLPAIRAEGKPPTVRQDDFVAFLERRGHPIPVDFIEDNTHRILIVDDDPEVLRTLSDAFASLMGCAHGCTVKTALDGIEAGLRIATFRPHLVVLDLMMPRLDGFGVCSHIKTDPATAGTPVLAITGDGSEQTIERILACGADRYLVKPIRLEHLRQVVGELLDELHPWPAAPVAERGATSQRS